MYRLRFRRNKNLRTTSLALLVACLSTPVFAQKHPPKQTPDSGQKQAETAGAQTADTQREKEEGEDENPWKGLQYRLVGPFRGGRVVAVSGVVGQDNVYYFGSTAGGVWKTTDGGLNWKPIFDKTKDASPAIGAIAVSESDPNVVYVGTGEACIRGNIVGGNGVHKSIDAGKTWKFVGLADTHAIGRLAVHPKNPESPLSRRSDIPLPITMRAARPGRRCFIRMPRPGPSMWCSIPATPMSCSLHCGKLGGPRGVWIAAAQEAAFIVPATAEQPGKNSKATD